MRTIALEEHFLIPGYRAISTDQRTGRSASAEAGSSEREQSRVTFPEDKLSDLGAGRLQDMDASGIDLQVLSHTLLDPEHLAGNQAVSFAQQANDRLAAAIAAHPDRFAGFALLPMGKPEAAVREFERAMR